ncbi:MAG: terpene cyclase/mutase family protein [Gemmataceae bacterium]|nr:terpene cyclase/mutase family protein [Gemmataceae bacterium]
MKTLPWAALLCALAPLRANELPSEYRDTLRKGLAWLARQQKPDGRFEGVEGKYALSMTALAGMAFLGEGSTMKEGRYRDSIRRAADWLMDRAQPNGLIGVATREAEGGRYVYGHGFGLLFLASLAGEEDSARRRERLMGILERACKYSRDAQTSRGGWGYVSAKESDGFDEGSVTITQMQALRAARNAGVIVPGEAIRMAQRYLADSTLEDGGICYSLSLGKRPPGKPALTAAAICCAFGAGEYGGEWVRKWLRFSRDRIGSPGSGRIGHDEYTRYYFAQVAYVLGEDRHKKLDPEAKGDDLVTWKTHRKALFDEYKRTQSADGSWSNDSWTARLVGPVYVTACYLAVMQLDKGALPIFQR